MQHAPRLRRHLDDHNFKAVSTAAQLRYELTDAKHVALADQLDGQLERLEFTSARKLLDELAAELGKSDLAGANKDEVVT